MAQAKLDREEHPLYIRNYRVATAALRHLPISLNAVFDY